MVKSPKGVTKVSVIVSAPAVVEALAAKRAFMVVFYDSRQAVTSNQKRVIDPLRRFGARISARDDNYLPMKVAGGALTAIDFTLPIASAQLKTCALLAGMAASAA